MSAAGAWLDLLLLALLAAVAVLLYRLQPVEAPAAAGAAGQAGAAWPLRSRFPSVARQAGYDPGRLRWFYWLAKVALAALLPLLLLEAAAALGGKAPLLWLVFLALLGLFLPDLWLLWLRRRRRRRIRRALSYYLDLLVALLHSGLSLEEAFRRAGREGLDRGHPLAGEVRLAGRELDAGQERGDVFETLAERCGVAELRSVATALGVAARHGGSVEAALETQADLLRTKRREHARRQVTAAATRAIFPLFLCGFPVFLVIVFFPAILELVETLRELASLF